MNPYVRRILAKISSFEKKNLATLLYTQHRPAGSRVLSADIMTYLKSFVSQITRTEVEQLRAIIVFFGIFRATLYKQKSATTIAVAFLPSKERQKRGETAWNRCLRVPDDSERNGTKRWDVIWYNWYLLQSCVMVKSLVTKARVLRA